MAWHTMGCRFCREDQQRLSDPWECCLGGSNPDGEEDLSRWPVSFLFIFAALFMSETDTSSRVCLSSERAGSNSRIASFLFPPRSLFSASTRRLLPSPCLLLPQPYTTPVLASAIGWRASIS